jgi:signal transduction histidine kinase
MKLKQLKFFRGITRFRLMLTLGLAVLLPAAALIYVNYSQLRSLERDKVLQAAIHRDFQEMLAITEKRINKKAYGMIEETRDKFPSPELAPPEEEKKLELILQKNPWITHVMLSNEKSFVILTQPGQINDRYVREEHEKMGDSYREWFTGSEGKSTVQMLHKRSRPMIFYSGFTKRSNGEAYVATVVFTLPRVADDRVALGAITFDPAYLKQTFFPDMLAESVNQRLNEQSANPVAMIIYPADPDMHDIKPLAVTQGWGEKGKPEVTRKFDEIFRGLTLGVRFQGTSVEALGQTFMHRSFLILGILSLLIIIGLVLTQHIVNKEVALAKLKSDFVSNVSHELRTPLALIRLYAETLELGRITTEEKKHQYYRIVRKESERLTALINNILDFSRIEAGHKEYEFRETDIADLVRNTLDSYRYQIEQQGFTFEEHIDTNVPKLYVDREAIARALVNLVNNALKYSAEEKFLGVNLYRLNGEVKLEVTDRGIGITRREQTKIFEKFYRTGDPLVHNTKGSGLGLSLVRHITEAHGGDIVVESTPGKGSKFVLSLPLASHKTVSEARA